MSACDADYCVGQQAAERYAFPVMVSVRKGQEDPSVNPVTQAAAPRGERSGFVTQQVHGAMVLQCIFVHSDWITDNANRTMLLFLF